MLTLLGFVLTVVLCLAVGALCHVAVLHAVIRREGRRASALATVLPPYLFYRGWKNAERLSITKWMKLLTASSTVCVLLVAILQAQMG